MPLKLKLSVNFHLRFYFFRSKKMLVSKAIPSPLRIPIVADNRNSGEMEYK